MTMILHKGAKYASLAEVCAVETPAPTKTHHPVAHETLIRLVKEKLVAANFSPLSEQYGLRRNGSQLFGIMEVGRPDKADDDYRLCIGLRNSHDRSLRALLGVGTRVFICDNLAFSAQIILGRKHTLRILEELPALIEEAVPRVKDLAEEQDVEIYWMKENYISARHADSLLVEAVRRGALPPKVFRTAVREWDAPTHEEFTSRNRWSLYNACTAALKTTAFPDLPRRTAILHKLLAQKN